MKKGEKKRTWPVFIEDFWKTYEEVNGCWIWTGNSRTSPSEKCTRPRCSPPGFKKQIYAYQMSYMLTTGMIPNGQQLCHRCDNPMCIRPDHLFLGTQEDNIHDMIQKGRGNTGERAWMSKLKEAQVQAIRRRYAAGGISHRQLANEYGVHRITILDIVNRRKWKHL